MVSANNFSAPLSSEHGKYKTVEARFWPWFSRGSPSTRVTYSCSARKRVPLHGRASGTVFDEGLLGPALNHCPTILKLKLLVLRYQSIIFSAKEPGITKRGRNRQVRSDEFKNLSTLERTRTRYAPSLTKFQTSRGTYLAQRECTGTRTSPTSGFAWLSAPACAPHP